MVPLSIITSKLLLGKFSDSTSITLPSIKSLLNIILRTGYGLQFIFDRDEFLPFIFSIIVSEISTLFICTAPLYSSYKFSISSNRPTVIFCIDIYNNTHLNCRNRGTILYLLFWPAFSRCLQGYPSRQTNHMFRHPYSYNAIIKKVIMLQNKTDRVYD